MNNYEFYELLLNNSSLYAWLCVAVLLAYGVIFWRTIKSILDPFLLSVFFSAMGTVTVFFLYFTNSLSNEVFLSYVFTLSAYYIGFFTLSRIKIRHKFIIVEIPDDTSRMMKAALVYFTIAMVVCHCIAYVQRGIPLFMISRLDAFTGGTGFGVVARFMEVTIVAVIYLYIALLLQRKTVGFVWQYHICIFLALIFLFLSGSKSSVMTITSVLFCYILLNRFNYTLQKLNILQKIKKILPLAILLLLVFSLVVIIIQSTQMENFDNPFFLLGLRFVHSGDVYWYSFPYNIYMKLDSSRPFQSLFVDLLGFLRIYDWKELPEHMGITLMKIQHAGQEATYGPNARINVFGLVYFGLYGSILFSFVVGIIVGFVRFLLVEILPKNFFAGILFTLIYLKVSGFDIDPLLTFTGLNNALLIYPLLVLIFLLLFSILNFLSFRNNNSFKND